MEILTQLSKLFPTSPALLPGMESLNAQAGAPKRSPEMEAAARSMGFKSAEEWLAWERRRNDKTGGTVVIRGSAADKKPKPKVANRPQGLNATLDAVSNALKSKK